MYKNPGVSGEIKLDYEIDKIFNEITENLDEIKMDKTNYGSAGNLINTISKLTGGGLKIKNDKICLLFYFMFLFIFLVAKSILKNKYFYTKQTCMV